MSNLKPKEPCSEEFENSIKRTRTTRAEIRATFLDEKKSKQNIVPFIEDWSQRKLRDDIKIRKKWNFHEGRLIQDRGIWQVDQELTEVVRYKIDKAEDACRRRMRLRRDLQASNKEYLNVSDYQKRFKNQKDTLLTPESIISDFE